MDGIVTNAMYGIADVTVQGVGYDIEVICWDTEWCAKESSKMTITLDEAKALWLALNEFIKAVEGVIEP